MDVSFVIRRRLEELEPEQKDLARAAHKGWPQTLPILEDLTSHEDANVVST
ncbi:MAG: hypothetical protein JSU87_14810 [Gemmatimonadota bacterium]|jgi:hypothetical protein|nr:MAG: hypothetical protein JSU87_14810 [Gemmatimonadota bacterium]